MGGTLALQSNLQLWASLESDNASGFNVHQRTGSRVTSWPSALNANQKVAKVRNLHILTRNQLLGDDFKKSVDHVSSLSLVQAQLFKQKPAKLSLCQRRQFKLVKGKIHPRMLMAAARRFIEPAPNILMYFGQIGTHSPSRKRYHTIEQPGPPIPLNRFPAYDSGFAPTSYPPTLAWPPIRV